MDCAPILITISLHVHFLCLGFDHCVSSALQKGFLLDVGSGVSLLQDCPGVAALKPGRPDHPPPLVNNC